VYLGSPRGVVSRLKPIGACRTTFPVARTPVSYMPTLCRISVDDIGLVAIQGRPQQNSEDGAGPLDEHELRGRVLSRARRPDTGRQVAIGYLGVAVQIVMFRASS
jgi:hypothetical protein